MAKQILRVEAIHSSQAFTAKWKHNFRIGDVPNADKALRGLNQQIVKLPPGETYNSYFERQIAELPYYKTHKIGKNRTLGYEFMLSYGTKNLPSDFSIEQWAEQSKKFLIDTFGKENVASAVLHMDEGTPHIHAIVFPIANGRLSARSFIENRQALRDMHVRYHEYTKECGLEAENRYTLIDHSKTAMFYSNINLALEKSLPGPEEGESLDDYANRANEFYKTQMLRSFGRDHQVSQLQKEKEALERTNRSIEEITKKRYEQRINEIMQEIGSVPNAKHAINYRDGLQKALEWTSQTNPDLAESINSIITNMQNNYERTMLEEQTQEKENIQEEI